MKKILLLMTVLSLLLMGACKKDSEPTKRELLTAGNWRITAATIDPGLPIFDDQGNITGYMSDMFSQMDACQKDGITKFNTDGTVVDDEGPMKCDPSDPQTMTGTWAFNTDETIITINFDNDPASFDIVELTSSTFKIKYVDSFGGVNYTETITFKNN